MLQQTNGIDHTPTPPDGVRTADPRDYSEVCRLLLLAHAEAGMFPASNRKVDYHVRRFLMGPWKNIDGSWMLPPVDHRGYPDRESRGIIGVIGESGGPPNTIEGLVMLGMGSYWYTENVHLEEYIMFVDHPFRTSRAGKKFHAERLIDWTKYQADLNNMQIVNGVVSNDRTAGKCRLLAKHYNKIGEFFSWPGKFESDVMSGPGRSSRVFERVN